MPVASPLGSARRASHAVPQNVGFIVAALALAYCVATAFDPPRLNWGDTDASYSVMVAGRNFDRYGFLKLRLTPLLIDRSVMTPADSGMVYTHYPQLPDLINGILRRVFRMNALPAFRLVALAFSFGSLLFAYSLIALYWNRLTTQLSLALWVSNPLWLQNADYLHQGPYGAFFGFGSVYFLATGLRSQRRNLIAASGLFLFLAYLSSYDVWIFVPVLLAAVVIGHYRGVLDRTVIRTLAILAGCAVAALATKTATNIWALGGIDRFLRETRLQVLEHSTDQVMRTGFASGFWPTILGRIDRFFSPLFIWMAVAWAIVGALWLIPTTRKRLGVTPLNPLILLIAAIPFIAAFRELAVAEYYPALTLIPFYAVGFGALLAALALSHSRVALLGAALLFGVVMTQSLDEDWHFKKAFFNETSIRSLRVQLDSMAPPGQRILVNHVFEGAYRYYLDRKIIPLIYQPANAMSQSIAIYSDSTRRETSGPRGAVLVQDKHVRDELFDKAYYWILYRYHLWHEWGNPRAHRRDIDAIVMDRDAAITREAQRIGQRVYEDDFYVLWRIPPSGR